jgi:tRNA A58 N-methylase Trm61
LSCAPFVPSDPEVVRRMLELAEVGPGDTLYDLGCGDARILIMAVRRFKADKAVGYELKDDIYKTAVSEVERVGLQNRIHIVNSNFSESHLSEASVITLYLTTYGNEQLRPKIEKEAKPGTRIVSHDFRMTNWKHVLEDRFKGHSIHLYKIPDAYEISDIP